MSISRLRMGTDGKGVSTLVAFFGCPLNCAYCINYMCHDKRNKIDGVPRASYTHEELATVLRQDELYYLMSGGGVVFGGGEPLMQSGFIHEVCKLLNPKWNLRVETSLNVPWEKIEPVLGDFDQWIIDIKSMNAELYESYTGMVQDQMKENLLRLKDYVNPEKLRIRVPRIPKYTTEDDIHLSVEWIKTYIGVLPEVFTYMKLPHTSKPWEW